MGRASHMGGKDANPETQSVRDSLEGATCPLPLRKSGRLLLAASARMVALYGTECGVARYERGLETSGRKTPFTGSALKLEDAYLRRIHGTPGV